MPLPTLFPIGSIAPLLAVLVAGFRVLVVLVVVRLVVFLAFIVFAPYFYFSLADCHTLLLGFAKPEVSRDPKRLI
jgi:hypothetical protein